MKHSRLSMIVAFDVVFLLFGFQLVSFCASFRGNSLGINPLVLPFIVFY